MDLLVYLARRYPQVVPKTDIFRDVWAGTVVSDDALTRCVGELRRTFGETGQQQGVLETVPKRGYRIVAPVVWIQGTSSPSGAEPGPPLAEEAAPRGADGAPAAAVSILQRHLWKLFLIALMVFLAGVVVAVLYPPARESFLWRRSSRVRSVAVLPFVNHSADPTQEFFVDGMTELLTSNLSKLDNLRVISRTSAMMYKGTRKPLETIAQELKVDALVEGSVLRSDRRIRIVAQLIDAHTDAHLWTETYERDFEDVLGLQAEIAEAIVRETKLVFTREDATRLAYRPRIKPEAYEAYLKGMFHVNKLSPGGFDEGVADLRRAVDIDPASPFAYAALAMGYSIMGHDRYPEAFAQSKAAAQRSLELGIPLAEAYCALGMEALYSDWDLTGAARNLQRALELKPNFAEARRDYSWYLRLVGRSKNGLEEMKRAKSLEPLVPLFPADLAWQYFEESQLDAAMQEAQESLKLDPEFSESLAIGGWVLWERGKRDEALAMHLKAASRDPAWKWPLARTYALMGRKSDAQKVAAELVKAPGPMDQWGLAVIYAALGDRDEAFRWLDAARKARFSWMPWIGDFSRRETDLFTPLRGDPKFAEIKQRIGIPSNPPN
jgi:TolB-like protein/DNA-binding winged helix-turn-helix (wHTH) protein/tetratricopeptide (TPR) repeat protein